MPRLSGRCRSSLRSSNRAKSAARITSFAASYSHDFTELVSPYADITESNEELIHTLIEKIIIHEKEIINYETGMRIEICYRFIGKTSDCLNRSVTPIKTKIESVVATDSIA